MKIRLPAIIRALFIFFVFVVFLVFEQGNSIAEAQTCSLPAQVTGVNITFPSCTGDVCNFTQGQCTWGNVSGATNYQVTVKVVETNATVATQQVSSSITSLTFPVAQSNTYKCDVSAINSCGTGPSGTASLLCKVDAAVTTAPSPVQTQNQPITVPQTSTNNQKVPVTGNTDSSVCYCYFQE
jgi:hypothetical protein